jgi:tyrosine-protein kinase Etk/Wzc
MIMQPPTPGALRGGARRDDEIDPREAWAVVRRNRGVIAAAVAGCLALGAAYTAVATPKYQAVASVRIDEKQSPLQRLEMFEGMDNGSQVSTEMEVLRSRTLAEAVVDSLQLRVRLERPRRTLRSAIFDRVRVIDGAPSGTYALARTAPGRYALTDRRTGARLGDVTVGAPALFPEAGIELRLARAAADEGEIRFRVYSQRDAVDALRKATNVSRPARDANIVLVKYESADPELVRDVPNALARGFIAQRRDVQKTEARSTVRFLRTQLDTLAIQLAASEDALRDFRQDAKVVSLEAEATSQVTQLAAAQAQRNEIDAERAALSRLLDEVRVAAANRQPGDPSPYRRLLGFPTLLRNQAATSFLNALTQLEDQRAELLARRTPRDPDVEALTQRVTEIESQLQALTTTYLDGLASQVTAADAVLQRFNGQLAQIPAKEVQFVRLQRRPKVLEEIYTLLQSRLKEAEITQAVEDPSVRVVDPAILPERPVRPVAQLNLALAAIVGLVLGVALSFVREQMDSAVHTREDVQTATGINVLGLIPRIAAALGSKAGMRESSGRRFSSRVASRFSLSRLSPFPATRAQAAAASADAPYEGRLVTGTDPRNPVSEAYRALRTNITFANPDRPPRTMVFTSPMPGDGKSTSAANLAITLAQQGQRVLLVDADLRRGLLNNLFDVPRDPGLSNVLLAGTPIERAVREVDLGAGGRLAFLPTGTLPPNPAELLGSEKMRVLIAELEGRYDAILFDSPPLNLVTDAALLGAACDGVVLVGRAGVTTATGLAYAIDQLRAVRAPVLGAVLNDVDFKRDMRYYGEYKSYGAYQAYASN